MRSLVLLAAFAFFGCHDGLSIPNGVVDLGPDLRTAPDFAQSCAEGRACNVDAQWESDGGCAPCAYSCMMLPAGGNTGVCVLAGP